MTVSGSDVRRVLLDEMRVLKRKRVAVMLSGGMDSAALLLAALDVDARPTAYTFALAGKLSTDLVRARRFAASCGVVHVTVPLPTRPEILKLDVAKLVKLGARRKTQFECVWPFLYVFGATEGLLPDLPADVVTGSCADGFFGISKKAMIHYRERLDDWRDKLFSDPGYAQGDMLTRLADPRRLHIPYRARAMRILFHGATWDELNRPKQKQPIRDAWPQLADFPNHLNLQLGDSGIAEHFATVARGEGFKSSVGMLNAAVRRHA